MTWETYTSYKESGIEWLGEIPEHLKVKKLKFICKINQHSLEETTNRNLNITYVDIGSVSFEDGIRNTENFIFSKAPSRARRIAKKNDTIISTVRTYLKAIDFIDELKSNYIFSTGFAILEPNLDINPKYLSFFVKSNFFTNQVEINSKGMSYPAINSTDLSNLLTLIPTYEEQTKIASFLDEKTTKIDEVIRQKEKLIELLKERKQIVINEAVTKGLDKTAELKESGVEWIGKIPKHWDLLANKHIFKLKKDTVGKRSSEYSLLSLTLQGIINRDLDGGGKFPAEFDTYQEVKEGDFVFCLFDVEETPRTVGLSKFDGMITGAYTVMSVKNMDRKYLYYFYLNLDSKKRLKPLYKGLRNTIPKDSFFSFKTFVPPKDEQIQIVEYIETQTTKIDNAIELQQNYIAKLKEYKATLIDSVVTGKVRIS